MGPVADGVGTEDAATAERDANVLVASEGIVAPPDDGVGTPVAAAAAPNDDSAMADTAEFVAATLDDDVLFVDRRGVDLQNYTASLVVVDLSCMECAPSAPITQDPSASLVSLHGHRAADPQYVFSGSLVDIDLSCLECCLPAPTNLNLEHTTSAETTASHGPTLDAETEAPAPHSTTTGLVTD